MSENQRSQILARTVPITHTSLKKHSPIVNEIKHKPTLASYPETTLHLLASMHN